MTNRITDPTDVPSKEIDELLARGVDTTVQFSRPCYQPELLRNVNRLCTEYGSKLEVRFYGHYSGAFDASVVQHIPDVRWLSVDCLLKIENAEALFSLQNLRKLSFGVYHFDQPDFLSRLRIEHLSRLALSESKKKNLSLAPLRNCGELEELYLNGHTKDITAISSLPILRNLSLGSISKRTSLEFVNEMPRLDSLVIILGGRGNIDEISHPSLTRLSVLRVMGLESLGDLTRFPKLRRLVVEDQIRLEALSLLGSSVEEVQIHNCKNLTEIEGLFSLPGLRSFRASRTRLDLDRLLEERWPDSIEVLALYSSSKKWNDKTRRMLDERGFSEFARHARGAYF